MASDSGVNRRDVRVLAKAVRNLDTLTLFMSNDELEVYEFLKRYPHQYVPVRDISRSVGSRRAYNEDRNSSLAVLRRMELDGWVEANSYGEYRLKRRPDETTSFKKALETPGMALGDTTIINFGQGGDSKAA